MKLTRQMFWMPLKRREVRRLFAAQLLSDFANWLDFIALSALIVYAWGYGSMAIAGLSVCIGLPWVIVGPLFSVKTGRLPGKKVLIVCDLLRAGIVLGMIWAPSLAILFLLVFLKMSVSSIFDPARQRAVKGLVEPGHLAQASSLSQMSVNLTKIFGPMAGGAVIGWFGLKAPFMIGTACYMLSALFLTGLPEWGKPEETEGTHKNGLRLSWEHMMRRPLLKAAILYSATIFFLIFLYDGLFILISKDTGMTEAQFGLLIGAVGAGSVIGTFAAGQWTGWRDNPLSRMTMAGITSGSLLAVAGLGAMGLLPLTFWLWLPICAALGLCGAQSAVPFGFVLQAETTDRTIVPVSAMSNALQTGSMLAAPVLGSLAAARIGAGGVFLYVGLIMSGVALLYRLRTKAHLAGRVNAIIAEARRLER